jgi:hypothetical protein
MDPEVESLIAEAQETLDGKGERSWLEWARERLMPETTRKVREEAEEAVRIKRKHWEIVEREVKEAAKQLECKREEKQVAERNIEREQRRKVLLDQLMDRTIDADTFQIATEALDKENDDGTLQETQDDAEHAGNVGEGAKDNGDAGEPEVSVANEDDNDLAIMGEQCAGKRKQTETMGKMRTVSGKVSICSYCAISQLTIEQCDRCAEYGEWTVCAYRPNDWRCAKCLNDKKGCFWGGISRDWKTPKEPSTKKTNKGVIKKKLTMTVEKCETRGAKRVRATPSRPYV